MTKPYRVTVQHNDFVAHVETDDFMTLASDPTLSGELIQLLDRHLVLHIAPQQLLTKEAVGTFAFELGFPKERRGRGGGPGTNGTIVPGFEFVADFGATAKPNLTTPRIPSYIETLHYDGISAYSVQANFNVPSTTPNLWADMRANYRHLPMHLKQIVDSSFALHAIVPPPGTALRDFPSFDAGKALRRPLVIRHFRTGEPLLYLPKNPASKIDGMSDEEGRAVLDELWTFVNTSPVRYTTQVKHNELVIWDGLGTAHTNPAYPRDKDRTTWFFIVPASKTDVEQYHA